MAGNQVQQLGYYGTWQPEIAIILEILTHEDFHQVFTSITRTKNEEISKQDAIRMIISQSVNPLLILQHQKVKIDVLVKYFQMKGVPIPPGPKRILIDHCLNIWGLQLSDRQATAGPTTVNYIDQRNYNCVQAFNPSFPANLNQQQSHQRQLQ